MPLSSRTIARVAAQTAYPLTVTRFVRPIVAIVRQAPGRVSTDLGRGGPAAPLTSGWESQSGTTGSQVQRHQPFVHSCTGTGHSRRACSIG